MIGFQLRHTHTNTHAHTLAVAPDNVNWSEQAESGTRQMSRSSSSPLIVVDGVSEARRVDDGQLELHSFLFDVHGVFDDLHGLVYTLCKALKR